MPVATAEDVSALLDRITTLEEGLTEAAESMRIIRETMERSPPDVRAMSIWLSALSAREARARKWLADERPATREITEADMETLRNYRL